MFNYPKLTEKRRYTAKNKSYNIKKRTVSGSFLKSLLIFLQINIAKKVWLIYNKSINHKNKKIKGRRF